MIYRSLLSLCLLAAFAITASAGTERTIDARTFMTPVSAAKTHNAQATAFEHAFNLQAQVAEDAFLGTEKNITLTNVTVPLHGTATLELERTASVFDATSEFYVATPEGKKRITVRPIQSFKGTINGDPNSWVTLHYNNGELTGYIQHAGGSRTVVGRAFEMRSTKGASPHFLADENASAEGPALRDFVCGSEDLPVDTIAAITDMVAPSSVQKGESVQQLPLTEIRLAIVLREDIFERLKDRGYDEEQAAQHFARIVASMSQAYEEDVRCRMFISYMLIFNADEPSGYFSNGINPGDLLDEFSKDWSSSYGDVDRTVAHLYTSKISQGGITVGGIAYGGQAGSRLCVKNHRGGYGVSTMDLSPPAQFPGAAMSRNAFVWDVFVGAHEIGHNIGSPHTHNCFWNPPVDTCQIQRDGTDACYDDPSLRRTRIGTIMSYCHLVNGQSTALTFGPRVSERLRSWMDASCMEAPKTPYIGITSPRGPEQWPGGDKMTIKFVTHRIDKVNLDYTVNGGTTWEPIKSDINAVDSQYVWTLPNIGTTELQIRASDASNSEVNYVSLSLYTVKVPIEVNSPSAGDRLGIGLKSFIQIRKDPDISLVDILYTANGTDWNTIVEDYDGTNYEWEVPDTPTEIAQVRVVSTQNAQIFSISDQFAIGRPTFELRIPAENGVICNNFDNQYRFSSDFIDRIRIQYSIDAGQTWKNAVSAISVDAYAWEFWSLNNSLARVPDNTPAIIQILESDTREVLARVDNVMISTCSIAVSVDEESAARQKFTIASVTPNPASFTVQLAVSHAVGSRAEVFAVDQQGASISLLSDVNFDGEGVSTISVPVQELAVGAYRIVIRSGSVVAEAPLRIVR